MSTDSKLTAGGMPQQIAEDGVLYAIIIPASVESPGLLFFTQSNLFLQVGQWLYDRGHRSVPHIHLYRPRSSDVTQEAIHVVRGAVEIEIYAENARFICSAVLRQGDTAILVAGGHAYTILEDNTKVLEFKNGPFTSAEEDRRPLSVERR